MNQFFKFAFASCLGVFLAIIAISALGFFTMAGLAGSGGKQTVDVKSGSILHLKMNQPIPERTNNVEMNPFDLSQQDVLGLNDILATLEHAAKDDKIKGILLDLGGSVNGGPATTASIRKALVDFKESGKFIHAYSKNYSQGSYYMASTADKVYLSPLGGIDLHGFAATVPFYKTMLDKIGVRMQVFYAGDFKSATEPYRRTDMSDPNRLQLRQLLDPLYDNFLSDIGSSRNKSIGELKNMANNLQLTSAEKSLELGMVDELGYIDNVIGGIKEMLEMEEDDKLKSVSLGDYANSYTTKSNYKVKDKIAVVYAEGAIYQDQGERGTIVDDEYVKIIRKIRKNDKIKAVVLRVNSPGGSAIASENIWREIELTKEAGKPVVVLSLIHI